MQDLNDSLHINFSRVNSNAWNNLTERSLDVSIGPQASIDYMRSQVPSEPPRPNHFDSFLEDEAEDDSIHEVELTQQQPEAKVVNGKQYLRMLKMRVKKGIQFVRAQELDLPIDTRKKNYMYESRHLHAMKRVRGDDGKFVPTRPASERNRERKKRGRKPKPKMVDGLLEAAKTIIIK